MDQFIHIGELTQDVRKLGQQEAALQEVARIAQQDLARIAVDMHENERFILRKDEMLNSLNMLQLKAQEKNKGLFEGLLTDLIREVMPEKEDEIVLTSTLRNNRASLDFDIMSDGNLENIDEDKGGSIANIVAMGLRFIVLARHPNRRVLLLDEADCHLKSEYIPAFAGVMRQLAIKMGIQVIYISHHESSNFAGYGRVIELYKEHGKTHSRTSHEESEEDKNIESMSAFRFVRLRDYGPHENLLVELSPGLNIITGDNDLGKSKVIQAIVDLMGNKGEERRIRHKRPLFNVEIGLEEGMTLSWQYLRKGSKRTTMSLIDSEGKEIETSDTGTGVPLWLDTYLSMPLVNGENIHFQSQKNPNYLLSGSGYTSIKRAEMLPLGRESREVHRMIQLFNTRLAEARQNFTRLQKDILRVKNTLSILSPVMDDPLDMDAIDEGLESISKMVIRQQSIFSMSSSISSLQGVFDEISKLTEALDEGESSNISLKCSESMQQTMAKLESASALSSILDDVAGLVEPYAEPKLHDLNGIRIIGASISGLDKINQAMTGLNSLGVAKEVEIKATPSLISAAKSITDNGKKIESTELKIKEMCAERDKIKAQKAGLFEKMGGVCPTCENPMESHSHD